MRVSSTWQGESAASVTFTFNGQRVTGRAGDTVASALLANDIRLVGRSFKYHRPRGILTAGSEEPNALVTVGTGPDRMPNVRATVQEIYQGLEVVSQNHIGPLHRDLMAVNDVLHPFLGAGFYYKTFMWPRSFWERVYEPLIRRAAGLGALSGEAGGATSEKAYAFCDVLVIGAGITGIMAALTAAEAGADVILAEDAMVAGGQTGPQDGQIGDLAAGDWSQTRLDQLRAIPNVRVMLRTAVTGVYDDGSFAALERTGLHLPPGPDLPRETFWRIRAKQAVLATGALERPIAFPGNDRPGIMMTSAIATYAERFGVVPGRRIAVFATCDHAHRTIAALARQQGFSKLTVIDPRPDAVALGDYRLIAGAEVIGTRGRLGLREITIRKGGTEQRLEADCLGLSGGWNPSVHLTCHLGARPVWDEARAMFLPAPGAVPGLHPAGACNGTLSVAGCLREGQAAALTALRAMGRKPRAPALPDASDDPGRGRTLWAVAAKGRAWLDFANDVTTKDVKQAAQEGFTSVEHMKRYTTQGMAPDQGKSSNIGALAILADATGRTISTTGTTTFRPPFVPVTLKAMGAGAEGKGFAPERLTTSHAATLARGAPMIEAGLWYRPSYFPAKGETTWQQSCDREVRMVRATVGVVDVSTLGKIEIMGQDAGAFLDFLYTNTFSTLPVGRARYGLMLREDGHVMDDGTSARLAPEHFVMTTTTAAAGQVMAHMEFTAQALRPDLDVRFLSVTEQWAQFSVAGPLSRELMNSVLDDPIDDTAFPFMGCGAVKVHGIPARLFRISFSGERAYEIAVPARYGDALYRDLVARAEVLGGGAYGMEALNVLRLEKGFITHAEIHGRVTAFDIGMQGMLSGKKDFIGKAAAGRPGLLDPARERLVGLKPVDPDGVLTAGARLFKPEDPPEARNDQGYVTSVGQSPNLGHMIALAFLRHGPEREGHEIMMIDALRGIRTKVEVVPPVFFDREGGRARG
ncbi:sarcosine oxidase subunit alpha family protein [Roseicyclus marinus]|uniref:sarcosine oxidase subunit alpha family protein n=1 Tax=Roseicyclus marinus TaxID=2161673 RepID=UPI00240FB562|nr:sarcosine oxidase subunit alpha family protein [Roseicyclus marinus]MDG3041871.1 sarcosine oxidase subunit alpha family protein [Roseicyclus marinus]